MAYRINEVKGDGQKEDNLPLWLLWIECNDNISNLYYVHFEYLATNRTS